MLLPVLVVATGLLLTLFGLAISIWINPPTIVFDMAAHAEEQGALAERRGRGDKTTPMRIRSEWSKPGVRLLVLGTVLQFIGTGWQVIKLACRG